MNRIIFRAVLAATVAASALSTTATGQVLGRASVADWFDARGDAQRTGWQRAEHTLGGISVAEVKGAKTNYSSPELMGGFGLQLKIKVDNVARGLSTLSPGVTLSGTGLGMNMGFFGASNNRTIGIDMDTGFPMYTHVYSGPAPTGTLTCPGATVVGPARPGRTDVLFTPTTNAATPLATVTPYGSAMFEAGVGASKRRANATAPVLPADAGAQAAAAAAAGRGPAGAAPAGPPGAPGAPVGVAGRGAAAPGAAPAAPAAAGRGPAPTGLGRGAAGVLTHGNNGGPGTGTGNTYTVSNDGKIHALTNMYGLDAIEPAAFIPAGAQPTDLIALNNVVYTSTVRNCNNTPNGVWGVVVTQLPRGPGGGNNSGGFGAVPAYAVLNNDPVGKVTSWLTGGTSSPSAPSFLGAPLSAAAAAAAGRGGGAFGAAPQAALAAVPAMTGLVATTSGTGEYADSVVVLNMPNLTVKASFKQAGANFGSAPVIFLAGERSIAAVQARDGRIFLLDANTLGTPLYVSPAATGLGGYQPAAMASWQDTSGQRWLLSTTATSVIAYKVAVTGNSASLTKGWELTGLKAPLAPIIVNGVVFAASSGEYVPAPGVTATIATRAKNSTRGVLHAVDGVTGEKLWNSGTTIGSFIPRTAGLWVSMGQVLIGAYDNNMYAFGTNMERHSSASYLMAR